MKIYTKTGDTGMTALFGGSRLKKSSVRIEAYGTVDELNALLGVSLTHPMPDQARGYLSQIQNSLFKIGADLATPANVENKLIERIDDSLTSGLEEWIDQMETGLPALKNFILPGGSGAAAHLHLARTVCRRSERLIVRLAEAEEINANILIYLNRLSDFLFVLARWVNHQDGIPETVWKS